MSLKIRKRIATALGLFALGSSVVFIWKEKECGYAMAAIALAVICLGEEDARD